MVSKVAPVYTERGRNAISMHVSSSFSTRMVDLRTLHLQRGPLKTTVSLTSIARTYSTKLGALASPPSGERAARGMGCHTYVSSMVDIRL